MPIEVNQINRECPQCKNPTIFDVDGKKYFCGKCLTDFDKDMKITNKVEKEPTIAEIRASAVFEATEQSNKSENTDAITPTTEDAPQ